MTNNIVQLVTSQQAPTKPVRACMTCRYRKAYFDSTLDKCLAVGRFVDFARHGECNHGTMWEPIPPTVPLLERLHRWLV
jgi:hypothetical protein